MQGNFNEGDNSGYGNYSNNNGRSVAGNFGNSSGSNMAAEFGNRNMLSNFGNNGPDSLVSADDGGGYSNFGSGNTDYGASNFAGMSRRQPQNRARSLMGQDFNKSADFQGMSAKQNMGHGQDWHKMVSVEFCAVCLL